MKHIWVKYKTGCEDVVHQEMLEYLLARGDIAQFYRTSETRWITPGIDVVRQRSGRHAGPERRTVQLRQSVLAQQFEPGYIGLSL